jgi:hypothetical protein
VSDDDRPYGTADEDALVTRRDLERAIRHLSVTDIELRDAMLQMMARVVALTDELTRRLDAGEPDPAPPGTPAPPPTETIEDSVLRAMPGVLTNVRAMDQTDREQVALDLGGDKYATEPSTPPCAEVLHLCGARCCTFNFALSTADLDEGVVRWDYGQPYLIRQRESDGYCVHNHPESRGCTVHAHRPRVCRSYDCRNDPRVWRDFANRIPTPIEESRTISAPVLASDDDDAFDLMDRVKRRHAAVVRERASARNGYAERAPTRGPKR